MPNNPDRIKIANADSWKRLKMPEETASLAIDKIYSVEEFEVLSRGLIPEVMEDKWFIFMRNNWLFFHRSWTGICIYQANFEAKEKEYILKQAIVNQNLKQHPVNDLDYEAALLNWLIDCLLLRKKIAFPLKQNLPQNIPLGIYQHHIAGTAFPETKQAKDSD